MPRLFIRHEPVVAPVLRPLLAAAHGFMIFRVEAKYLIDAGLSVHQNSIDMCYVAFVHEGQCFAGRTVTTFTLNNQPIASVRCVPFNDDPSGKKMILADMILD